MQPKQTSYSEGAHRRQGRDTAVITRYLREKEKLRCPERYLI
jgi:hypothetical protein